tara:strand:- start:483 stop:665 length:183 start_codon:yes stop_codon:yes gene_type:complete
MISTSTRLRVKEIISRIEKKEKVALSERIYLSKIASVSLIVKGWLTHGLGIEAVNIDESI